MVELINHSEIMFIFNLKRNKKEMCHYNINEIKFADAEFQTNEL